MTGPVRRFETIDSTNREARAWAREGASDGALVTALTQTAGRGRRGRGWISAPGAGLWMSVVLRPAFARADWALLSFAAALAVRDACARQGVGLRIKWPNDLLLDGRKVCGILLETEGDAVIVGIGVNIRQRAEDFPQAIAASAGSLEGLTGRRIDERRLETDILEGLLGRERLLAAEGREKLLAEYTACCATLGRQVTVISADGRFEGTALAVETDGALRVRRADGETTAVQAADVSVRGMGPQAEEYER